MIYLPDMGVLFVYMWIAIGTGLLFYFRPLSVSTKRIRILALVAMLGAIVAVSSYIAVPFRKGEAYLEIWLPLGLGMRLRYYPYGVLLYKLLPFFAYGALITAIVGPLIYLVLTRRDSLRR